MQQSMFIIVYAAASSTAVIMHGVRAVVGGYREAGVQRTWPHRDNIAVPPDIIWLNEYSLIAIVIRKILAA